MLLLPTDKCDARAFLIKQRNALSAIDVTKGSQAICNSLLPVILHVDADDVLLFSPIGNEPDLLPLAQELLHRGKRVYFPISQVQTCMLDFRAVTSLDELCIGTYKIKEPPHNNPPFENRANAVCVVPALSYDTRCMRIGYGKGYYDRFLQSFKGISLGVAFSSLLSQFIPTDKYDIPVDAVITEEGVTVVNEQNKSVFF